MLRLTSSDLPTVANPEGQGGAFYRLWNSSSRSLFPLFRYRRTAGYNGGFEEEDIPLGDPSYGGTWFQITLEFDATFIQVSASNTQFRLLDDPLRCQPATAWGQDNVLNLYSDPEKPIAEGDNLAIVCEAILRLSAPSNNQIVLDLADYPDFNPTKITASGLEFLYTAGVPTVGQFSFSGGVATLRISEAYNPGIGAEAIVRGLITTTLPEPSGVILTFDLNAAEFDFLEGVDYLGISFGVPDDPYLVSLNEFFWAKPLLSLFVAQEVGGRLVHPPIALVGTPAIGSTTYETWTNAS